MRRLLPHWQHESVDDNALELLEEGNLMQLRLTAEQARLAHCFLQVLLLLLLLVMIMLMLLLHLSPSPPTPLPSPHRLTSLPHHLSHTGTFCCSGVHWSSS